MKDIINHLKGGVADHDLTQRCPENCLAQVKLICAATCQKKGVPGSALAIMKEQGVLKNKARAPP